MWKLFVRVVLAGWIAASPLAATPVRGAEEQPGQGNYPPPVQAASDGGEQALKRFRVAKGLKVELAAAEPLLANPVAFSIDEKGRFYVVETFRLHAGVTDIRGHMDWLDEELAVKTVEERVAYMTRHEGKRIAEYTRYSDRLRLVWDSDGDGKADQATVFADGFSGVADGIAAGVLSRWGDVYFANIPNLWRLKDTKGTGRADVKTSLSYGYGVRVGFLGHDLHGLRFGPDGRLYFSIGDRGAYVKNKEGRTIDNRETGVVYRCEPDGANLEFFATGLRNPQELAFDQWGNLWTGDNNSDGGDPARWVYVVEGGDSGWRVGWQFLTTPNQRGAWLSEKMCYPQFDGQAAYLIPPVANIANGPAGLAYYPGTGLNGQFKDKFFLCDFRGGTGSGIHSFGVTPRGAGFELVDRSDFIWDVLVTDGDFGYDGCFYLTDWVNGWNQTGKGRIYRVFDPETRGSAAVAEVKQLFATGFAQRPAAELAALLAHADQRVRQEAQFALVAQGATAALVLRSLLEGSGDSVARLHAVWGLGQLLRQKVVEADAASALVAALGHADPEVRSQAAKVLGDAKAASAYDGLVRMLGDAAPRPRFFAAIALSRLGRSECVPAVLAMLRANGDQDRYLRHAGVMALTACATPAALKELVADSSAAVRLAAVVALRRSERPEVAEFLNDSEATIVLEAARAINDLPLTSALPRLGALLENTAVLERQEKASLKQREGAAARRTPKAGSVDSEPDLLYQPLLRRIINARFRTGRPQDAVALVAFAGRAVTPGVPSAVRAEAVTVLADWAKPSGRDAITGLWRPLEKRDEVPAARALQAQAEVLLKDGSRTLKLGALKTMARLRIKEAGNAAYSIVSDSAQAPDVRREALKALAIIKSPRLSDAIKVAAAGTDEGLRNEATRLQAQLKPGDATGPLKAVLESGSLREKQNALATLGSVAGAAADQLLAQWVDKLIARQVPPELQLDVLEAAGKRSAMEVKDRLIAFERARPAADDLRAYRECLEGGDAEEGRKIFVEKAEVSCIRCHKAGTGTEGGEVGPDLSALGTRKPREYILESIVFPNQQIAAGFDNILVTLNSGTLYAGLLKSETEAELEINSPEDGLLKLKKSDVKSRQRGLSAMPEEMRQILTRQELRNLVEFLFTVK